MEFHSTAPASDATHQVCVCVSETMYKTTCIAEHGRHESYQGTSYTQLEKTEVKKKKIKNFHDVKV